jgi:hypothetical protein
LIPAYLLPRLVRIGAPLPCLRALVGAPAGPAMASSQRRGAGSWWSHFAASALRVKAPPSLYGNDALEKRLGGNAASAGRLSRKLGVLDLILLGIGASIGAGIFVITGTVAHDAGPGKFTGLQEES